jgi:dolichol kinase
MQNNILMPGDMAGNYDKKWTETFDLKFLILWIILFAFLLSWTIIFDPNLFEAKAFFLRSAIKLFIMMILALAGGILCRHYCNTDEKGYIISSKNSWFKVNYTRKIQHFAAYLVPLLSPPTEPLGILPHLWESLFVLFMFLVLIKPIREFSTFFMLQFNSLDRVEDRPNTLKWIVLGNMLPGLLIITVFKQVFETYLNLPLIATIVVLTVAIGDGLAEPVGTYLGKKKYVVPSWNLKNRYVRSYAGSACVYIAALLFLILFKDQFANPQEFWSAIILFPPIMTLSEAFAPHSMDTPIMMFIGYSLLFGICIIF